MRTLRSLQDGWYVKELAPEAQDIPETLEMQALTREAAEPGEGWMATAVPAQVHDVLLTHGRIPDPRVGKNAAQSAWVGERDWVYATTFATPPGDGPVLLRFDGLDTLGAVYVNGQTACRFINMYRRHVVDVRPFLRTSCEASGERNILLVVFMSPLRFVEFMRQRHNHVQGIEPHHFLRKCHSDFGSYLGARPHSVKVGIFDAVTLDVPDRAWLEDVWVRPVLSNDYTRADVRVAFEIMGQAADVAWALRAPDGRVVAQGVTPTAAGSFDIAVDRPQLWWPRTHGQPALYTLQLVVASDGVVCDSREISFGIREVRPVLRDERSGEDRFAFDVNGRRIFLRGACWAPLEGMTHCWNPARARRLLDLAEQGNMNVLRVWAEGYIPPQDFYAECDRRGILVWQDFMFGYGKHPSAVPGFGEGFMANCRAEIGDTIRRLRNHPCLLLWCGGNENHMGWDFAFGSGANAAAAGGWDLFGRVMPELVAELDPDRHFHPSSPYGGPAPNWPLQGDWHDYTTLTFSPAAAVPLYASEVGRASSPSVSSLHRYMSAEELWPDGHDPRVRVPGQAAWPEMWQYRSVDGSWDKVGAIEQYPDPTSAEDLVRVLGTAHGEYLQQRVERHRRGVPDGAPDASGLVNRRCWGNMIWRLNDAWPILYWSAIDYYLEPKIAWYFLRRAYEPVLVCFERTAERICAWVVNDSPEPVAGRLAVQRMRFDGAVLGELACGVDLAPGASQRCLDLTPFGPIPLRHEFLRVDFAGREATLLLIGERYLHLPPARLTVSARGDVIDVSTDVFARQVSLQIEGTTGAVFSDNYFDLAPGGRRTIHVIERASGGRVAVTAVNAAPPGPPIEIGV